MSIDLINLSPAGGCEFSTAWIAPAGISVASVGPAVWASADPATVVKIEKSRRVRRMRTSARIVSLRGPRIIGRHVRLQPDHHGNLLRRNAVADQDVFDECRRQPLVANIEDQRGDRFGAFALLGALYRLAECALGVLAQHTLFDGSQIWRRGRRLAIVKVAHVLKVDIFRERLLEILRLQGF